MDGFMSVIEAVNNVLWHDWVLFILLGVGILFTAWSAFGQYRALTHGTAVIRGIYDRAGDPGAISHFQALSAALSATVGLGNIAGVAIAVAVGGPGAVFWMWVTGFVGMALKLTEVTQAMLHRNLDNPEDPHGGAMWVCKRGFAAMSPSLGRIGTFVGGIFCITLIISTVTGGNMFQAWNVADITFSYFGVPKEVTGLILTVLVGLVIIGGIKRIGSVAGRLVPFMCSLYLLAGLFVIISNLGRVPDIFGLIFRSAFSPSEGVGAFLGGTAGFAFLKGMQRALFSNEAGQGSAPIAHSAARTDEPVREGVVAGLEPFIDTLVVCTITALVILLSGVWNREPALAFVSPPEFVATTTGDGQPAFTLPDTAVTPRDGEETDALKADQEVFAVVEAAQNENTGNHRNRLGGVLREGPEGNWIVDWDALPSLTRPTLAVSGVYFGYKGATLTARAFDRAKKGLGMWIVPAVAWLFALSTMISWSYYGEQGSIYLFGPRSVMLYRMIYCALVMLACTRFIRTESELDIVSTLGTGVMLWANIPIMLIFGRQAMKAYHGYIRDLKAGRFPRRDRT